MPLPEFETRIVHRVAQSSCLLRLDSMYIYVRQNSTNFNLDLIYIYIYIYLHFSTHFECSHTRKHTHTRTRTQTHARVSCAVRTWHWATDSPFRLRFDGPPPPSACGSRIRTTQVTRNKFRCNNSILSLKLTVIFETQQFSLADPLLVLAPDSLSSPPSLLALCVAACYQYLLPLTVQ